MPSPCCVPGCKSNYKSCLNKGEPKVSVFTFPRDESLKAEWVRIIPRSAWSPTKYSVVCAKHFADGEIIREDEYRMKDGSTQRLRTKTRLKLDAVPSIFPYVDMSETVPDPQKSPAERTKVSSDSMSENSTDHNYANVSDRHFVVPVYSEDKNDLGFKPKLLPMYQFLRVPASEIKSCHYISGKVIYQCSLCLYQCNRFLKLHYQRCLRMNPENRYVSRILYTSGRDFKCEYCEFVTNTLVELIKHKETHEELMKGGLLNCAECKATFFNPEKLRRHLVTHKAETISNYVPTEAIEEIIVIKDEVCSDTEMMDEVMMPEFVELGRPILEEHVPVDLACEWCPLVCSSQLQLAVHLSLEHPSNEYFICPKPNCTFSPTNLKDDLKQHLIHVHKMDRNLLGGDVLEQVPEEEHDALKKNVVRRCKYRCPDMNCHYLNYELANLVKHVLKNHQVLLFAEPRYLCPDENCIFYSNKKSNLRKHLIEFHLIAKEQLDESNCNLKFISCTFCKFYGKKSGDFKHHFMKEHTPDNWDKIYSQKSSKATRWSLECVKCGFKTPSKKIASRHGYGHLKTLKRNPVIPFYKCMNKHRLGVEKVSCWRKIAERQSVPIKLYREQPEFTDDNTDSFECKRCRFTSPDKYILKVHQQLSHKMSKNCRAEPFKCPICSEYRVVTKRNIRRHLIKMHNFSMKHLIELGGKWKGKHVEELVIENDENCDKSDCYACNSCAFATKEKSHMNIHKQLVHRQIKLSRENVFVCPICPWDSMLLGNIKIHLFKEHSFTVAEFLQLFKHDINYPEISSSSAETNVDNSKPFACDKCYFVAKKAYILELHEQLAHTFTNHENPFLCPLCPYTTFLKKYFKSHLRYFHIFTADTIANLSIVELPREPDSGSLTDNLNCDKCHFVGKNASLASIHRQFVHSAKMNMSCNELFKCPYCMHVTSYKHPFLLHFKNKHKSIVNDLEESIKFVDDQGRKLNKIQSLHFQNKINESILEAERNCRPYPENEAAQQLSCNECYYRTYNNNFLITHKQLVHGPSLADPKSPFKCQFCTTIFIKKQHLRRHFWRVHCVNFATLRKFARIWDEDETQQRKSPSNDSRELANVSGTEVIKLILENDIQKGTTPDVDSSSSPANPKKYRKTTKTKSAGLRNKVSYKCGLCRKQFWFRHALNKHVFLHARRADDFKLKVPFFKYRGARKLSRIVIEASRSLIRKPVSGKFRRKGRQNDDDYFISKNAAPEQENIEKTSNASSVASMDFNGRESDFSGDEKDSVKMDENTMEFDASDVDMAADFPETENTIPMEIPNDQHEGIADHQESIADQQKIIIKDNSTFTGISSATYNVLRIKCPNTHCNFVCTDLSAIEKHLQICTQYRSPVSNNSKQNVTHASKKIRIASKDNEDRIYFQCWMCGDRLSDEGSLQGHARDHAIEDGTLKVQFSEFKGPTKLNTISVEVSSKPGSKDEKVKRTKLGMDYCEYNPSLPVLHCSWCKFKTNKASELEIHENLHCGKNLRAPSTNDSETGFTCGVCYFKCFDVVTFMKHWAVHD